MIQVYLLIAATFRLLIDYQEVFSSSFYKHLRLNCSVHFFLKVWIAIQQNQQRPIHYLFPKRKEHYFHERINRLVVEVFEYMNQFRGYAKSAREANRGLWQGNSKIDP